MESPYYIAKSCGTLGELYQGPFFNKDSIEISVISALSNNSTYAQFTPNKECNLAKLKKEKVAKSLSIFFEQIVKKQLTGHWNFTSNITIGVGMSSSTADIISALRCASKILGLRLTLDDITTCLYGVERSDSVFIDVPCLYLSQQQKIIDIYKPYGKIYCIYGLENKTIDTTKTRDTLISYYHDEKNYYQKLLDRVRQAYSVGNKMQIIECSTNSTELSQGILPKQQYPYFKKQIKRNLADGMIVAHTGSLLGYLYTSPPDTNTVSSVFDFIKAHGLQPCYGEIF